MELPTNLAGGDKPDLFCLERLYATQMSGGLHDYCLGNFVCLIICLGYIHRKENTKKKRISNNLFYKFLYFSSPLILLFNPHKSLLEKEGKAKLAKFN